MTRKERIANGLMDFADHGGFSLTLEQMRRADAIRKRFNERETAIGTRALECTACRWPHWHAPAWARHYREAASMLMSNRRLP